MGRIAAAAGVVLVALLLTSCSSGALTTADVTGPTPVSSVTRPSITGPTLVVTVPELVLSSEGDAAQTVAPTTGASAPAAPNATATEGEPAEAATATPATAEVPPTDPAGTGPTAEAARPAPAEPSTTNPPAAPAPAGAALNLSLANCDGCAVLATHRDVVASRSAALVGTGSGRGMLLSVGADGHVAGVIGVPYGAAFNAPADGVLPCAQGRCVVTGRQADGRAILSAFELTDSGAWRDMSGDDAFPSATERSAVVDLDGELAIAVQDQGNGSAVWMLYTWGGERYAVLGCAPDGDPPTAATAVSPSACLS